MSLMWLEDADVDSAEYDEGEDELYDDSESEESEESEESRSAAARRRRQAQQRRIALARRRQAMARSRGMPMTARPGTAVARPSPQRQTAAAIRALDLETKVQEDSLRGAIAAQRRRMSRSEYASVAGVAVNQAIESFGGPDNPYLRAAARFSPLLLLSPQRRGTGLEAVAKDPRVIAAAAMAVITFAGDSKNRLAKAATLEVIAPPSLPRGGNHDRLLGEVRDTRGRLIQNPTITWESDDTNVLDVNNVGYVTTNNPGTTFITARFDGLSRTVRLRVT